VDRKHVNAGVAWIKDMAKGAALCTQTKGVAIAYFGMHDLVPNTPMAQRFKSAVTASKVLTLTGIDLRKVH
jgi:aminobenzoyl-glutamate utilization protein B